MNNVRPLRSAVNTFLHRSGFVGFTKRDMLHGHEDLRPVTAVQRPVLDRLGDMFDGDRLGRIKIGDRTGHLQNAIVGAGAVLALLGTALSALARRISRRDPLVDSPTMEFPTMEMPPVPGDRAA